MTATRGVVRFVVAVSVTVLAVGHAMAQDCPAGCGPQRRACTLAAKTDSLACKLDCRTNAAATDLGACNRACMDTFRAKKDTCGGEQDACRGVCVPPPAPAVVDHPCLAGCGSDLAACAKMVVTDGKACVIACKDAADRLGCLQNCGAMAQSAASTCATDFSVCAGGCGALPPPPPPPPPSGQDCVHGCGTTLTQCLADVGSAALACAGACPSGANRLACLEGCAMTAKQDAASCEVIFDSCVAGCATPP